MLVDLVLEQQGRCWRMHVERQALPLRGQAVELLEEPALAVVVVGISKVEEGNGQAAAATVLLRWVTSPRVV